MIRRIIWYFFSYTLKTFHNIYDDKPRAIPQAKISIIYSHRVQGSCMYFCIMFIIVPKIIAKIIDNITHSKFLHIVQIFFILFVLLLNVFLSVLIIP